MVEKIDRPEAPPPYQITRPKDAKEDQHKPPEQREEQERRYQKEITEKGWDKFGRQAIVIKPMRVAREAIGRLLFGGVFMRNGVGILKGDIIWKDGRKTTGALFLLSGIESFIQLKKFNPGQEVSDKFWAYGPTIEIGIVGETLRDAPPPMQDRTLKEGAEDVTAKREALRIPCPFRWLSWFGIADRDGTHINWEIVVLYVFLLTVVTLVVVFELR